MLTFKRSFTINLNPPSKGHLSSSIKANNVVKTQFKHLGSPLKSSNAKNSPLNISHTYFKTNPNTYVVNVALDASTDIVKPSVFVCALDVSASMNGTSTFDDKDPEASKFSRLDLVKHSMNTIIHCLRPVDTLAMVAFSDNASNILSLNKMDDMGKKAAINSLKKLDGSGSTNLWDGLDMSLNEIESIDGNSLNKFSVVLTDGEPNINPPRGIFHEFMKRIKSKKLGSALHTFGYGYNLDSFLLNSLAKNGGGLFAHVPDHSMCSTVFINYLSNCLATAINKVDMKIDSARGCSNIMVAGNKLNEDNVLNVGAVQSGQTQNILLEIKSDNIKNFRLGLDFEYDGVHRSYLIDNLNTAYDCNSPIEQVNKLVATPGMVQQIFKSMLLDIILKGVDSMDLVDTCKQLDLLCTFISDVKSRISVDADKKYLDALLLNIKSNDANHGQIYKAFSNSEWFNRWGIHYLQYFVRSHQLQICTNFKDASLQSYGGNLFREIRAEVEDIFAQIPVPQPSRSSIPFNGSFQNTFYTPSGPCFDGFGEVKVPDGFKLVKDLVKGDIIRNSDGNDAEIVCVIKTQIKGGSTDFVFLGNGMRVTPWHPVRINGKWDFPVKIGKPLRVHCDYIYNFVLSRHHIMTINGIDAITLGHNLTSDPVIIHPFFGTDKVILDLKTQKGWSEGLVEISEYKPMYENGLISSFFEKN